MQDKPVIDGIECRYWFRVNPRDYRKCSLRGGNDNCDEIKDCFIKELLGKLALKEQEYKELKHKVELMMDCASCKVDEYKQTLAEIKALAIVLKNICPEFIKDGNDSMKVINEILQKISECEVEKQC